MRLLSARWSPLTFRHSIKHDAKALADYWSPEAVYLNRTSGEEVVGRNAIAEQFAALLKEQPELKLEVIVDSVQFLSPNVAVEHGTTKLLAQMQSLKRPSTWPLTSSAMENGCSIA